MDKQFIEPLTNQQFQKIERPDQLSPGRHQEIELREKAVELEGLFITQLFKSMEKTIHKDKDSGNTLPAMMFSSIMGQAAAEQGGIGLSDLIYESLEQKNGKTPLEDFNAEPFLNTINMNGMFGDISDE